MCYVTWEKNWKNDESIAYGIASFKVIIKSI